MPTSGPSGQCCQPRGSTRYALALKKPTSASGNSSDQPRLRARIGKSRQRSAGQRQALGVGLENFAAQQLGAAQGSCAAAPATLAASPGLRVLQGKIKAVADEPLQAVRRARAS